MNFILRLASTVGLSCFSVLVLASDLVEFEVNAEYGNDSNPFLLNDALDPESSQYFESEFIADFQGDAPVYLIFKYYDVNYDDDRANTDTTRTRIGYESEFAHGRGEWEASLENRIFDKTYISRSSGEIFTFRGEPAEDRYDYDRWTPKLEGEYEFVEDTYGFAEIAYRVNKYTDLTELGLDDLDYDQLGIEVGIERKVNRNFKHEIAIDGAHRQYDSRPVRDRLGTKVRDIPLEYDYLGIGYKARYIAPSKTRFYGGVDYVVREDNLDGYYDYTGLYGYLRLKHRFTDKGVLRMGAYYKDLDYDRGRFILDVETDAESPSNKGWQYFIKYERPAFKIAGKQVNWYAEAVRYDFSADQQRYEYDRTLYGVGLSLEF